MAHFLKTKTGMVCAVLVGIAILAASSFGIYGIWLSQQPKFHDVTIELGSPLPALEEFMTEYASQRKAQMVTDGSKLDLAKTGQQSLVFRHGNKEETVILTIADTTAPQAVLKEVNAGTNDILNAQDFIAEIIDYSNVTVDFVRPPVAPEGYGEDTVQLILTDESGNSTLLETKVFYYWIRNSFTMELGYTLTKNDLLLDAQKDALLLDQEQLDAINAGGAGTYTVTSTSGDMTRSCTVTVQDTVAPTLEVKDVTIYTDDTASAHSFVKAATDISGDVELKFATEPVFGATGTQTVTVEAIDKSGNVTRADATLTIIADTSAPGIYGVTEITIDKNQTPDYLSGVYAYDQKDGFITFTYNANNVDISKAGTYYVAYSATDKAGNTTTFRRKVTVRHDLGDTMALVRSIAASLPNDPKAIRNYVRETISYNTYWGSDDPEAIRYYVDNSVPYENWNGNDPIWYGFTAKTGNCIVHALCLQALLTEKGYNTQIIWVKDQTHYWLIIETADGWRHIDATPSTTHGKYDELMTDEMRYETLATSTRQRDWDRQRWPVCE